jgi:uncharacterized membrane protein YhiD involved in acid resistance
MEYIKIILDAVIPTLAPIIASAFGLVAIWALHQLQKKFGVEASAKQDELVFDAAQKAVWYAEEWAKKQVAVDPTKLPSGAEKLAKAMEFVKEQLDARNVKEYGEAQIVRLLESALHVSRPLKD